MDKIQAQKKLDEIQADLMGGLSTYWSERLGTEEGEEEFSALLEIVNPSTKGTPYIPDPNEKPMSKADQELLDAINDPENDGMGGATT